MRGEKVQEKLSVHEAPTISTPAMEKVTQFRGALFFFSLLFNPNSQMGSVRHVPGSVHACMHTCTHTRIKQSVRREDGDGPAWFHSHGLKLIL